MFYGDGYNGLPEYAPFNKILITAAASEVPDELVAQLKMPGTMVLPLGKFLKDRMKKKIIPVIDLSDYQVLEEDVDAVY